MSLSLKTTKMDCNARRVLEMYPDWRASIQSFREETRRDDGVNVID